MTQEKKMEINEAIKKVLSVQYKKEAKDAFKVVEDAGFEIYKMNGTFGITDKKNVNHVRIELGKYRTYLHLGNKQIKFNNFSEISKIDFVSFLEKERIVRLDQSSYWYRTETQKKMERLRDKKRSIQYSEDDIERIKKKIEEAQKELIWAVEYKEQKKADLKAIRKELGLKERR